MIGIGRGGSLNRGLVETRRVFESSISKNAFPFILQPGVFIRSPIGLKKGEYVQLRMLLPGMKIPFAVTMAAMRWNKGTHCGGVIHQDVRDRLTSPDGIRLTTVN